MRSPAASITALCEDGLSVVDAGRLEDLESVMARLSKVGRPDESGSIEEIEAALLATQRLYAAMEREAARIAEEIAHVRQGKRALSRYGAVPAKDPRAIDMSA